MPKPYVNFSEAEFRQRQERVRRELAARGLDGLLISRIEDQHWLCGLDTDGFVIFHIMFIGAAGQLTHVTRTADLASIDYSSLCDDVRVWEDAQGNPKSKAIKDMLGSHGMAGKRIGIQLDTFGLLPALHLELRDALDGWCEVVDASDLVRLMRLVKSPAELDHHRQAGRILDRACARAIELTAPGAEEGHVLAEVYRVIWEEGADIPANRMPMGHGDKAMNVRYVTGRGSIGQNDQVTFEMGDAWRHYHVADMFTVLTGPEDRSPPPEDARSLASRLWTQSRRRCVQAGRSARSSRRIAPRWPRTVSSTRSSRRAATRWAPLSRPRGWSSR